MNKGVRTIIGLKVKITQKYYSANLLCAIKHFELIRDEPFSSALQASPNRKTETLCWECADSEAILNILIPMFDKYPLITSKWLDYQAWREIANDSC